MMGVGFLFIVLIWGAIIIGAIWIGKNIFDSGGDFLNIHSNGKKKTALEILESRYAQGEITREEFETMKNDIT